MPAEDQVRGGVWGGWDYEIMKIEQRPKVDCEIVFSVNEAEARALDALVGYGDDAFIKAFKDNLGSSYLENHEAGLRQFFKDVRGNVPPILSKLDRARKAFSE